MSIAFNRGDLDGACGLFVTDALIWGVLGASDLERSDRLPSDPIAGGRHYL